MFMYFMPFSAGQLEGRTQARVVGVFDGEYLLVLGDFPGGEINDFVPGQAPHDSEW
jgi:hypothetical protein